MSATEETSAVRAGHEMDEKGLALLLSNAIDGFGPTMDVRQFKGGNSNPTFMVTSNGRRYVLRKKPPGALLPSAHMVEREYFIMNALAPTAVPVPRMRILCEEPGIIGTSFYVMDCLDGRVFRDTRLPGLAPEERANVYDAMNRTLASLHTVDWQAAGLGAFGKPANYIQRQVSRWSRQYEASKTHDIPAMDELMKWLPENIPADDSASIAHGDFRLENLIFAPDEARVIGLIDWELATIGHPLSDLAFNCMNYRLPSSMTALGGLADVDIVALGIPDEKSYVAAYCERVGREAIADWDYYVAFALFRCAAILQGVFARSQLNSSSSDEGDKVGRLASPVASIAWEILANRGK